MEKCGYSRDEIENTRKAFFRASRDDDEKSQPDGQTDEKSTESKEEMEILSDGLKEPLVKVEKAIEETYNVTGDKVYSGKLEWVDHKTLPPGWKCAWIQNTLKYHAEGAKIMKLLSPDGKFINSRVSALKYMSEKKV